MAAMANILGTAFLGVQMKCARCHDAPHHDAKQKDLFKLAAMLGRGPQEVPKTSSVPRTRDELDDMRIEVTLEPGSKVEPGWPFGDLVAEASVTALVRDVKDSRERLAALITSPENDRFALVIVNRLWKRYLGYGLVEPVDDWQAASPSHPELLEYLGRELMAHDYDLKHLARLILNSRVYQRAPRGDVTEVPDSEKRLFAGPARRRVPAATRLGGRQPGERARATRARHARGPERPRRAPHLRLARDATESGDGARGCRDRPPATDPGQRHGRAPHHDAFGGSRADGDLFDRGRSGRVDHARIPTLPVARSDSGRAGTVQEPALGRI